LKLDTPPQLVEDDEKDPYWVDALAHGLAVLRVFEYSQDGLNLSDIALRLGWSRTKPHRYVHTLERLGYLSRNEATKRYRPTSLTMTLGYTYLSGLSLIELAQPAINQLRDKVGASVHLGILEQNHVVYIASARVALLPVVNLHVGSIVPPYATSIGRMLLAHLDESTLQAIIGNDPLPAVTEHSTTDPVVFRKMLQESRERGYAMTDEEFHPGVRSIAAPIRDRDGSVVAAINATSIVQKFSDEFVAGTVVPHVIEAAGDISRGLGYMGKGTTHSVSQ